MSSNNYYSYTATEAAKILDEVKGYLRLASKSLESAKATSGPNVLEVNGDNTFPTRIKGIITTVDATISECNSLQVSINNQIKTWAEETEKAIEAAKAAGIEEKHEEWHSASEYNFSNSSYEAPTPVPAPEYNGR